MHLGQNLHDGITLDHLQLYLLLFADDAVSISETPEGLQRSLDSLHTYSNKWNLKVNTEKTRIMVFRKGGTIRQDLHWYYAGQEKEIINSFNYLGVIFSSGGSLRSVRIFRVLKIVRLEPSSKHCFSYLTTFRHASLI